ncbi:MAG TPA: hypothetical protein VFG54_11825 [Prolixibacteraceae bacterium]|nr:hypothetical protein [Prolixibacteraceae bacterium]
MREEILRLLEKGKELHEELVSNYKETLPSNVIEEGNRIVEKELPGKINSILVILNADARMKKYKPVANLQQAIELFSDPEMQNALDKSIANKGLAGLSICEDCFVTVQELLDTTKYEVQTLVNTLSIPYGQCKTVEL